MKGQLIRELCEIDYFTNSHFDGVVTTETLGSIGRQQHFVILNIHDHWIYLGRPSSATLEAFDPLGWQMQNTQPVLNNKALLTGIAQIRISKKSYQPIGSTLCGEYCLFFAYMRLHHIDEPFSHVLSTIFSDDPSENETIVNNFCTRLLDEREQRLTPQDSDDVIDTTGRREQDPLE